MLTQEQRDQLRAKYSTIVLPEHSPCCGAACYLRTDGGEHGRYYQQGFCGECYSIVPFQDGDPLVIQALNDLEQLLGLDRGFLTEQEDTDLRQMIKDAGGKGRRGTSIPRRTGGNDMGSMEGQGEHVVLGIIRNPSFGCHDEDITFPALKFTVNVADGSGGRLSFVTPEEYGKIIQDARVLDVHDLEGMACLVIAPGVGYEMKFLRMAKGV